MSRALPITPVFVALLGRGALGRDRGLPLLMLVSASAALLCCLGMFDLPFLAGISAFWHHPAGVIARSWADMSTALSGYDYFIRDDWRLPLFQVARLGGASGSNIIYTDSTPIVALLGRMLFQLTGQPINLFGAWLAACLVGSALSMTLLAYWLGARSLAAALTSAVFGLCAPALLGRWGHTTLMAQFEVILALALYFAAAQAPRPLKRLLWAFPICALALWTHAYLFAMVAPVVAASILQALIDRRLRASTAAVLTVCLVTLLAAMFAVSGYLGTPANLSAPGFGTCSTNLLSPVYPELDQIAAMLKLPRLDATGYQYEGFCYLGAGALLLLCANLRRVATGFRVALNRHGCLSVLLIALIAFAVSDEIFIGNLYVAHVALPEPVLALAGLFRASGRFVWPAMYLVMAVGIAGCNSRRNAVGVVLLLAACGLQWIDMAPLRAEVASSTRASVSLPIDTKIWEAAIARHRRVMVWPVFACIRAGAPEPLVRTLLLVQLMAGRENVATNSVYLARDTLDCPAGTPAPRPGELSVYWLGQPGGGGAANDASCSAANGMAVCSDVLNPEERSGLLPQAALE